MMCWGKMRETRRSGGESKRNKQKKQKKTAKKYKVGGLGRFTLVAEELSKTEWLDYRLHLKREISARS
jgi:hypothetical protein